MGDREKAWFLFIIGGFGFGMGIFRLLAGFAEGRSLSLQLLGLLGLGLVIMIGAVISLRNLRIQADPDQHETLQELEDQPSDCTACGAWNPPGSEHCGECGAALEGAGA